MSKESAITTHTTMKKVIILLYAFALSVVAFATGQEGDVIYINGEKWFLLGKPIGSDSILRRGVDSILPENRDEVTSNWSGYTAYWSIYNKQLFLDSILVECYNEVAKKDYTVRIPTADMQRVFKDYYKKKNILATWVDYNIRAAKGPILYYEHMGYERNHEYEQVFTIKKGMITDCKSYHNRVAVNGFSFKKNLYEESSAIALEFPLHFENYPELADVKIVKFSVGKLQLNSLGQLLDCKVKATISRKEGDERKYIEIEGLAKEMKEKLMEIFPWRTLFINGEYVSDIKNSSYFIRYNIEKLRK